MPFVQYQPVHAQLSSPQVTHQVSPGREASNPSTVPCFSSVFSVGNDSTFTLSSSRRIFFVASSTGSCSGRRAGDFPQNGDHIQNDVWKRMHNGRRDVPWPELPGN